MGKTGIQKSVDRCLEFVRSEMSHTPGSEEDVLREFSEQFGAEVAGWDMRLEEIKDSTDA